VSLSVAELVEQRSMLMILIATCTSARTTFEEADYAVDEQLCADLNQMIERAQSELAKLHGAISQSG
jgi:cellobiose-specific phosphotransferase system component IIA